MISQAHLLDHSPRVPRPMARRTIPFTQRGKPATAHALPLPMMAFDPQGPAIDDAGHLAADVANRAAGFASGVDTPVAAPAIDPLTLMRDVVRETAGVYTLKGAGDGMQDALVAEGDVVMLQRADIVGHGELAAVRLRHEGVTKLRRVYFENGRIRLQPDNRRYPPAIVPRDQVEIQGRVIAIVRQGAGA